MPQKSPVKAASSKELPGQPAQKRRSPESFRHIHVSMQPPVAKLTLDRPEHNLLNEPMLRELADALDLISQSDDLKIILLESAVFLNELYRLEDSSEGLRALIEKRKPQWKNR